MRPGEPSGPIQLIPPGLLGLLQIKSPAGQNPNVLNGDVQPTVDMLPFWLRANRIVWPTNSGITLVAGSYSTFQAFSPNTIAVPEREWWYVHSYTARMLCAVGGSATAVRLAMAWNAVGTIRYQPLGPEPPLSGLGNMDINEAAVLRTATGFWAPPGSVLGFYVSTVVGADFSCDVRGLDYTPCPI